MTLKELLKIIKKHSWWSEEAPAAYQCVAYPLHCYIEQAKYFHPRYSSIGIWIFKNDFFYEETSRGERYEIYKFIFNKISKDKAYLRKQRAAGDKNLRFLDVGEEFSKNKSKLTNFEIWESYEKFMMKYYMEWLRRGPATIECADVFSEEYLPALVKKELKDSDGNLNEIMAVLTAFPNLSFIEEERFLFLKAALAMKKKSKESEKLIKKLTSQFFWIRNTFVHIKILNEKDYTQEIRKEIKDKTYQQLEGELLRLKFKVQRLKKNKENLYKKYRFSPELKLHFYILKQLGEWIDHRKKYMLLASHYINLYCKEIAKKYKEDLWKIQYYLPWELKDLLLLNKRVPINVLKNRRQFSVYVVEKEKPNGWRAKYTIFYKEDAKKIFNAIFPKKKGNKIKGQVANAPISIMRGKVQIILDTYKQKFIPGRILVTTMTRPDFIPIMHQAKAIITDEGGITCHAAIISRELGIPCVIGTKIATRVLKDGQLVEVDANKGVVKVIK